MVEYIEREALLRYLNDIWLSATPNDSMPDDDRQLAMVRCMGLNDAMDAAKSIPAADVRPVVKAHWTDHRTIKHDGEWYCTACGKEITIYMGADRKDRYKFCPNCGAMMEES